MTIEPERLAGALTEALGEPATLVVAWTNTVPTPAHGGPILRAVYAFPSRRLATLRHWRDEVEFDIADDAETTRVVALEASKWARLLLKSHGGALLASASPPAFPGASAGPAARLPALARDLWDPVATEWAAAAGVDPLPEAPALTTDQRFERVETWLWSVRELVDSPNGAERLPGARPASPNQ